MPFPVQRIQTDRGQEFFAYNKVQEQLQAWRIKFRPIRPRSPHLNGPRPAMTGHPCRSGSPASRSMVERAQRTALEEFWTTAELKVPSLGHQLAAWQTFFIWQRPHAALGGRSPIDRVCELLPKTPLTEQVWGAYDPSREPIGTQEYHWDTTIARQKRCLRTLHISSDLIQTVPETSHTVTRFVSIHRKSPQM